MERTQQLLEEISGEPLTGSGFEGEPFVTEDGTTLVNGELIIELCVPRRD
jgi:hypothetical protein